MLVVYFLLWLAVSSTYRCTPDETSICSWTLIEPAIEVLSGCLPTMAPLLKVRIHPKAHFSSIFHLSFYARGWSSASDSSKPNHGQYSRELNKPTLWPRDGATLTSNASARPQGNQTEDSDLLPLQSIVVRKDIDWRETQNKDRHSEG